MAGASVLSVVVRHGQDTEAGLETLGDGDPIPLFELQVPSGRIEIGDAEQWDTLHLRPDTWLASARTAPVDHPERLELWFTQRSS